MAKKSKDAIVKKQGGLPMYGNNKKLYFWTRGGKFYLNHGGKCIMLDTGRYDERPNPGIKKFKCFSSAAEAKRMFDETYDIYTIWR